MTRIAFSSTRDGERVATRSRSARPKRSTSWITTARIRSA
jgi:hypothetical protein